MLRAPESESERGSGSVLAVAIVAAMLMLFSLLLPVVSVLSVQQRAAGAADAAALAAADVAVGIRSGSPCEVASTVALANSTRLDGCVVDDATATVRVTASVLGFEVSARATAGRPPGGTAQRVGLTGGGG
ncbi:flp pilus-assembly TadE/G-like family protein [Glaciihabitans sp. INWT7]|uniref:Rv3654c family TadE-like protein n=1 Tax=Glaciihabitans sp. INWT7 TaxID=2596912 RepID=UPI0016295877|nr:Rv3654c family TadE-like protein [Glaciihabitans sp. INWT7]QNE45852.1 flp pilus-assembly TadE/G-like family protein [Glaciihabitans sp. INWT7]